MLLGDAAPLRFQYMGGDVDQPLPPEPPKYEDIVLTPEQEAEARERWPDYSPARAYQYMRLSVLAHLKKQYVDPTTGRALFGGPQPNSGRKATKRIGAALVEAAQGRQKEVIDAAFAPLAEGNDPMDRHKAALNLARHEQKEREMDIVEDEYARKTDADVRRDFARVVAEMVRSGQLSPEDLFEGSAELIDERQLPPAAA